jgi:hypothetical protein
VAERPLTGALNVFREIVLPRPNIVLKMMPGAIEEMVPEYRAFERVLAMRA